MVARVIDHPFGAGVIPTPYNPDPALLAIVEVIRAGLLRDQHVRLHKFGTFRLRWNKERRVKHPKTGKSTVVPSSPRITFTPAKQLREWIEPNPKPVLPLNEPVNSSVKPVTDIKSSQEKSDTIDSTEVSQTSAEQPQEIQPNLQETVQDIIDEQYSPPESLSAITSVEPDVQSDTQSQASSNEPHDPHKKWGLGLLAAVPLIIFLLQSDFTNDNSGVQKSPQSTSNVILQTQANSESLKELGQDLEQNNLPTSNKIIRTEESAPENQQSTTSSKPTTLITARSEATPKPFYMSPQVHTIQQGENLWNLAKQFYGDALLWPHIYRANTRTLSDPDKIISGNNLVIPGLQQPPQSLSTKDNELVAEGYFMVYQFNKMENSSQAIHFLIGAKQYSFEWLRQKRSQINKKDWNVINRNK